MTVGLRRPPTSFVGRSDDLAELAQRLERGGLITLHGPPGVGKTRLAIEHAVLRADAYPGGAWLCDLYGASAARLTELLLRTLGLDLPQGRDPLDRAASALAERGRCLLVLDAFERLVPDGVATVAALRDAAPDASLLVTSRTRLRLPGEIVFGLEPLPTPRSAADAASSDAVRLFVERARAVRRAASLEDDVEAISRLVRALDGLPLAIELAAARARVRTPAELVAELARAELLAGAIPSGADGNHALDQAIEASWTMLEERERSVLAQLSVFRGGFTSEAAERVVSLPSGGSVLASVEELVDRSLLGQATQTPGDALPRFGLLISIRDFAASKLAPSPAQQAAVERRHADHYLAATRAWRQQIDTHQGPAARQRIEAEMENVLAVYRRALDAGEAAAALEVALAIDAALMPRGPHERRIALLDAALRVPTADRETALSAEAIFARAHAKRLLGHPADAIEDCETAAALAEAAGDLRLLGRALGAIGLTLWEGGDSARAAEYLERALPLHTETADRDWLAATLNNRGLLELADGRLAAARGSFEEALRAHRAVGNRRREAMNLNNLAYVDAERGLLAAAHATLADALGVARKSGDLRTEATVTLTIGLVHLDAGEIDVAQARSRDALALAERSCDRLAEAQARAQLGQCLHAAGDLTDARVQYGRALALCRDAGARGFEGLVHSCLASLEASAGRPREARAAIDAASEAVGAARDAGFEQARSIARAHVELCGALGGADAKAAVAARATADKLLQAMAKPAPSPERRLSIHGRFLAARVAQALALPPGPIDERQSPPDDGALLVESDGRWFRVPGSQRVSLHRRRPIGRVLRALVDARLRAPGSTCPPDALLAYGWPGERCDPRSGAARVYNALATLRKLGLRTALLSRDDGYLLDPEQAVRVVSDALR